MKTINNQLAKISSKIHKDCFDAELRQRKAIHKHYSDKEGTKQLINFLKNRES